MLGDTTPTGSVVAPRLDRGVPGPRSGWLCLQLCRKRTVALGVREMTVTGQKRRAQVLQGDQDAGLTLRSLRAAGRCYQVAVSPRH